MKDSTPYIPVSKMAKSSLLAVSNNIKRAVQVANLNPPGDTYSDSMF
ncbi:hypothetical protein KsCSTR_06360 [Candidatus Kuenenia stuttgartiensis]|uniref:Uncharacterized protein n=1 Tax=Kuenenia stuttgartiensis TaxID=174633 RepID=A0A6G7GKG5_KUEST|nr:hypothetical protein KsCSTR_06360 [Candidatus Kuenenia stuttgartiensis]